MRSICLMVLLIPLVALGRPNPPVLFDGDAPPPAPDPTTSIRSVVLVGASNTTQGYFDDDPWTAWTGLIRWSDMISQTGIAVTNRAVGGADSSDFITGGIRQPAYTRWTRDEADAYLFNFSWNDYGDHSVGQLRSNLQSMIAIARSKGAISILATSIAVDWCPERGSACSFWPTKNGGDPNDVSAPYDAMIRDLAAQNNDVYLMDVHAAFRSAINSGVPSADCYLNEGMNQPCPGTGNNGLQITEWSYHITPRGSEVYFDAFMSVVGGI